jgi:heme-degrading monooxygenase HmoA
MPFTRRDFVQTASVGAGAALGTLGDATPTLAADAQRSTGEATRIIDLDDRVTFRQQLEHNIGPAVLMSTFLVPPDQVDNFLEGFKKQFAIMRKQPGLISAQLHRGIAGSGLFMNYIVWETVAAFKHGYELPEFQAQLKEYPPGTVVSANFFQRVPVAGMCLGEGTIAAQ